MKRFDLLDICARITGHDHQHALLRKCCSTFNDWERLLQQAELEGMAPLLQKHLEESASQYPLTVKRSLKILAKRHKQQATVRHQVLRDILMQFQENDLTALVLKGAALCHTLYPDPGLRPMRDMDLLLHPDTVDIAQELLKKNGFTQATSPIPPDHFHLPSLHKTVDGVKICVELHRGLYPDCPPYYPAVDFNELLKTAKAFALDDITALTFNDEEMLHYLFQHCFHAPLTYEPYKLINCADIIGFTEINFETLNWDHIKKQYPLVFQALPLLHHISPWDNRKIPSSFLSEKEKKQKLEITPFQGWPRKRRKDIRNEKVTTWQMISDTFLPSSGWLRLYHGARTNSRYLYCLFWEHPKTIYWWFRLYRTLR